MDTCKIIVVQCGPRRVQPVRADCNRALNAADEEGAFLHARCCHMHYHNSY